MARNSAGTGTGSTLDLYWDLASLDENKRINAATRLISALEQFQASHGQGQEVKVIRSEEELKTECASDVSYAVERLVKGLGSSRKGARQGFSVALTELLAKLNNVTATVVLDILFRVNEIKASMTGQELRDMMFGRLFCFMALVEASVLERDSTRLEDVERIITETVSLSRRKSYLRQPSFALLERLAESTQRLAYFGQIADMLVDKALKKGQINTPDELSLAFKLQILSGSERGPLAISSWKGESVLDTANLPRYRGILRESSAEDPALFSTWHPEPHPLWDTLFSVYFGENESLKAWRRRVVPFVSLWQAVVENGYFKPSASNEHKFWGLQLLERSASMLDANNLGAVLTPNALKCVIANSTTKEKSLHKVALRVLAAFTKAAEIDSQAALVLMTNLTGKSGVMNFDKATRSKTIASIVAKLDVGPLTEYILYLQNAFLNPQKHGGAALGEEDGSADGGSGGRPQPQQSHEALVDSHRQWAMDQLLALVRNPQLPRREEWLARILRFFIVHGFYILVKDIPRSKVAEARIRPTPELSDKVQQGARERFFSVMGELNRMPLLTLDKKQAAPGVMPRRYLSVTESGELWAEVAVRTMIDDLDKQKHVQPLLTIEDSDTSKVVEEARKRAVGVAEGIRTRYKQIKAKDNEGAAKRCEQYRAFELLIWNLLLQLAAGEYEAAETLDEVCECYSKVLASDESAAKGHSGDRDEEQPIVVLVDVLVSFLAKPSNMLRKLTETVFTAFVSEMTLEALEVLTQVLLDKDGSVDDQGEEDDDTMEGDAGGQMGNGVRDSDAGDVSDDEDTSDDDGSDSEDKGQANGKLVPVDEELREKIREALGESAVMDENASEDEVLFDDEQMAVFDDKLTEIFSNKKVLKKEKRELQLTIQNFKLRILELANIFLSKQSSSPCVFKFISDLLSFSQIVEGNAKMRPLYDKVISILSTRRSTTPASFDSADALELLKELHVRARKSATGKANLQMLTSLATFVVRSLLTNSERTNSDVEALSQLYADSLRDFFARKSSQLQVTFFVDTLQRLNPTELPIVWKWVDVVAGYTGPSDVVNVFRQLQAYALLTEICKSFKRYLVVKDANPDLVAATAKTLVLSILERASETFNAAVASDAKGYNANRLKTFLSETHTILRSSQQHLCSDSKPTLAEAGVVTKSLKKSITKSLESIQGNEKFKNSPAILGLIRSLSVTIGLPSDRAADQTGTAGKSGSVRKRKARGSDGDSSEKAQPSQPVMLSGSKKSRK